MQGLKDDLGEVSLYWLVLSIRVDASFTRSIKISNPSAVPYTYQVEQSKSRWSDAWRPTSAT
jgi:hypothetical protein